MEEYLQLGIIVYKNERGQISFDGSGSKNESDAGLIGCEGFGLPTPEYKHIEFAAENGVTETGKKDAARTITLSGDIQSDIRSYINRVFHMPGELFVGNKKIKCKCIRPPEFSPRGGKIFAFAVQLQADYPYFTDAVQTKIPIYGLTNLVTDTFELPCVFTKRVSRGNVKNTGEKYVYPVIVITGTGASSETSGSITITNHTLNASVVINHVLSDGEVITLDFATRKIKSSVSGNVTNLISDDTDLSKFYFEVGDNDIEFCTTAQTQTLRAAAKYYNEYYSAEV